MALLERVNTDPNPKEIKQVSTEKTSEPQWKLSDDWTPTVHEDRLRRALEMIETQLPHSVRELASELRLSPTHLQRLFKQETGVQISRLLTQRRLRKASDLLTTTNMDIKEIAYAVGYGHHSSFVRAFQRRFRQSPKQYRRQHVAAA